MKTRNRTSDVQPFIGFLVILVILWVGFWAREKPNPVDTIANPKSQTAKKPWDTEPYARAVEQDSLNGNIHFLHHQQAESNSIRKLVDQDFGGELINEEQGMEADRLERQQYLRQWLEDNRHGI